MESPAHKPCWIGLFAESGYVELLQFGTDGVVLERRRSQAPAPDLGPNALAAWVDTEAQDWLSHSPQSAIIAAGIESYYPPDIGAKPLTLPLTPSALNSATAMPWPGRQPLYVLPSLKQTGVLPDHLGSNAVASILGVITSSEPGEVLIGILAEQHHWLRLNTQQIRRSHCFITPQLQALLFTQLPSACHDDSDWHSGAFDFGLALARGEDRHAGLLASLASPSALIASGQLAADEAGSFKHGLLIGHELLGLMRVEPDSAATCPVLLVGDENRCLRYARALQLFGYEHVERAPHAAEHGLWQATQSIVTASATDGS